MQQFRKDTLHVFFTRGAEGFLVSVEGDVPNKFHLPDYIRDTIEKDSYALPSMGQIGQALVRSIFNTKEREQKIQKIMDKDNVHLSICISSDELTIHKYPWELINSEGDFLLRSEKFSIYRSSSEDVLYPYAEIGYPLKLLVILSLPLPIYQESPVSILEEWETLYDVLSPYVEQGKLEITVEEQASKNTLCTEHFAEKGRYHFVHFVGHGLRGGHLLLENDANPEAEPELLTVERAIEIFRNKGIVSTFFNACETALSSGKLPDLLYASHRKAGIPIALGYQRSIADKAAVEIAKLYYRYLLEKDDILLLMNKIRRTMDISDPWWLPVIWLPRNQDTPPIKGKPKKLKPTIYQKELIPIGEDFIYRYESIRKIGRALRSTKTRVILLYGLNGTGKSSLASYISIFYKFLFRTVVPFCLTERKVSPAEIIKEIYCQSTKKKIKDNKSIQKLWQTFIKDKAGKDTLIVLDDMDTVLDIQGVPKDKEWEEFLDLLMRTNWGGKCLITSRSKIKLSFWKPGTSLTSLNMLKIQRFNDREGKMFLYRNLGARLSKQALEFCSRYLGFHPFGLRLFLEKLFEYGEENVM